MNNSQGITVSHRKHRQLERGIIYPLCVCEGMCCRGTESSMGRVQSAYILFAIFCTCLVWILEVGIKQQFTPPKLPTVHSLVTRMKRCLKACQISHKNILCSQLLGWNSYECLYLMGPTEYTFFPCFTLRQRLKHLLQLVIFRSLYCEV